MPFIDIVLEDFLGKGITYPFILENGKPPIKSGFQLVESSIKICTAWPKGTRILLAEFGSRLTHILEEQNSDVLRNLISTLFKEAVEEWEPRVEEVIVNIEEKDMHKIKVIVQYRLINSPQLETFIFPFYKTLSS